MFNFLIYYFCLIKILKDMTNNFINQMSSVSKILAKYI